MTDGVILRIIDLLCLIDFLREVVKFPLTKLGEKILTLLLL